MISFKQYLNESSASDLLRKARKLGHAIIPGQNSPEHDAKTKQDGSIRVRKFSTYENPIPREHSKWSDEGLEKLKQAQKNNDYKIEDVPIHKIKSRQNWIRDKQILKTKHDEHPTAVKHTDGHHVVLDGNHRVAHALLKGHKSIKMKVYNAPHR